MITSEMIPQLGTWQLNVGGEVAFSPLGGFGRLTAGPPGHGPMAYINNFGDVSNHLGLLEPDLAMLWQKVAPRLQCPVSSRHVCSVRKLE